MPRLAVLGQPLAHSRSPAMQNAALAELGLADEWSYEAIEVGPEEFEQLVRSLPGEGFAGVNVTVPHKLAALAVADRASEAARAIGAANTLTFVGGGIEAENTDAIGLIEALPGRAAGKRAVVLGAGGSARAAIWALRQAGARVAVWNRTSAKARELAGELGAEHLNRPGTEPLEPGDFDLLVNATTVGLEQASAREPGRRDLEPLPLGRDSLAPDHVIVDLVYGRRETALARLARTRGARLVDGLEILVRQGAASLRLWTGLEPPLATMRAAARGE